MPLNNPFTDFFDFGDILHENKNFSLVQCLNDMILKNLKQNNLLVKYDQIQDLFVPFYAEVAM
jgi:hypothetical protein